MIVDGPYGKINDPIIKSAKIKLTTLTTGQSNRDPVREQIVLRLLPVAQDIKWQIS